MIKITVKDSVMVVAALLCGVGLAVSMYGLRATDHAQEYVDSHTITYVEFKDELTDGNVEEVTFFPDSKSGFIGVTIDGVIYYTTDPDYDTFKKDLLEAGVVIEELEHVTVAGK